jgi:hypothetical protein
MDKEALWAEINSQTFKTGDVVKHKNVDIVITKNRWNIYITIFDKTGNKKATYVADAGEFYTDGDGIWFGTKFAYDKIWEEEGGMHDG